MPDYSLYEKPDYSDALFPIRITYETHARGPIIKNHWHEQIELLYFIEGKALIKFNSESYIAEPGDLLIANSNELHSGEGLSDLVSYYCIIINPSLFHNSFLESCHPGEQDIRPQFRSILNNQVFQDRYVKMCMKRIMREHEQREPGYELVVKSLVLRLLAVLIRKHSRNLLSLRKYDARLKNLDKLNKVLEFIEENYNEKITVDTACQLVNLSSYYFCRLFKSTTGKTFSEYVNDVRIQKAELLLKHTDLNITEVAIRSGFNDLNYFSRLFRKLRKTTPSLLRKATDSI